MAPCSVGSIELLLPISSGRCLTNWSVSWFSSPVTSNGACRFPVLRSPLATRRFVGRNIARGITEQLGSFAPWELPRFIATAALPPPTRLPRFSRFSRLSVAPAPEYFSLGPEKSLQLLNMPSSPCCPYHSECHVALVRPRHAMRPSLRKGIGLRIEVCLEATCGFTFVTGDSLSILRMALSASS